MGIMSKDEVKQTLRVDLLKLHINEHEIDPENDYIVSNEDIYQLIGIIR